LINGYPNIIETDTHWLINVSRNSNRLSSNIHWLISFISQN